MGQTLKVTEPTIWALRKSVRKSGQDNDSEGSLYEHLFGYDPIRVATMAMGGDHDIHKGSAENPKLNIINSATNFLVREMASDDPSNA